MVTWWGAINGTPYLSHLRRRWLPRVTKTRHRVVHIAFMCYAIPLWGVARSFLWGGFRLNAYVVEIHWTLYLNKHYQLSKHKIKLPFAKLLAIPRYTHVCNMGTFRYTMRSRSWASSFSSKVMHLHKWHCISKKRVTPRSCILLDFKSCNTSTYIY
jgi:hypothetical protein